MKSTRLEAHSRMLGGTLEPRINQIFICTPEPKRCHADTCHRPARTQPHEKFLFRQSLIRPFQRMRRDWFFGSVVSDSFHLLVLFAFAIFFYRLFMAKVPARRKSAQKYSSLRKTRDYGVECSSFSTAHSSAKRDGAWLFGATLEVAEREANWVMKNSSRSFTERQSPIVLLSTFAAQRSFDSEHPLSHIKSKSRKGNSCESKLYREWWVGCSWKISASSFNSFPGLLLLRESKVLVVRFCEATFPFGLSFGFSSIRLFTPATFPSEPSTQIQSIYLLLLPLPAIVSLRLQVFLSFLLVQGSLREMNWDD